MNKRKPKPVLPPLDEWEQRKIIAYAIAHREIVAALAKREKALNAIEEEQQYEQSG